MFSIKRLIVHLRRRLPPRERLVQHWAIKPFAHYLDHPKLWHAHRTSFSKGIFIGLFCAWLPLPGQMLIASVWAVLVKANIPASIALTWLSNPFTMAPIYLSAYVFGNSLVSLFIPSWESNGFSMQNFWSLANLKPLLPLFLGSTLFGLVTGVAGWLITQRLWIQSIRLKKNRRLKRRAKRAMSTA